jgi:hypothetical protein
LLSPKIEHSLSAGQTDHLGCIGHEIDAELQSHSYPVLWQPYLTDNEELMNCLFEEDLRSGWIKNPLISPMFRPHPRAATPTRSRGAQRLPHAARGSRA